MEVCCLHLIFKESFRIVRSIIKNKRREKEEKKIWNGDSAKSSACRFNLLIHHSPFLHGSTFEMLCIRGRGKSSRCLEIFPPPLRQGYRKGAQSNEGLGTHRRIFYLLFFFPQQFSVRGELKRRKKRIK